MSLNQKKNTFIPPHPPKNRKKPKTKHPPPRIALKSITQWPFLCNKQKYIKDKTTMNIRLIKRIEIFARPLPYIVARTLYGSSSPSSCIWTLYGPSSPSSSFPLSPSGLYGRANYTEYIRFISTFTLTDYTNFLIYNLGKPVPANSLYKWDAVIFFKERPIS